MTNSQVLIADDDNEDFEILKDAIVELKLSVVIERAENGEILIKILNEKIPDLLFLDILMPCKDGRQCLKEIRANKKFDLLPIIVFSSLRVWHEVEFCFREGANLFSIKPSSFVELKAIIEKIFAIDWRKSVYYPPLTQFVINPERLIR